MYLTFGEHAKKSPEEVIRAAKKQKFSEDALDIVLSPISTFVKKGVKTAVGEKGQTVSERQFIKAVVLQTLKEYGLLPKSQLRRFINGVVNEYKPKRTKHPKHPFWTSYMLRSK